MYSVRDYGDLISDRVRPGSYAEALRRTVKPGSVVLDIGTARESLRFLPVDASGKVREHFDQSTLAGTVLSLAQLRKHAADHSPKLSGGGILDRKILELMDGYVTLEEISRRVASEYPEKFSGWHDAMKFVGALSRKYSQ